MSYLYAGAALLGGAAYYALRGGKTPVQFLENKAYDADAFVPYKSGAKHYVTEPDAEVDIGVAQKGAASLAPTTIMEQFQLAVKRKGDTAALRVERGGRWIEWTWREYYDDSIRAAKSFVALGVERFGTVNIIGFNSPEWFFANNGAIACGAKAAGIYTTNEAEACHYISEHSKARVVVCEDVVQVRKYLAIRDRLPHLKAIVMWLGDVPLDFNQAGKCPVYSWQEFLALGDEVADSVIDERIAAQRPGHASTLIYTSGTTGNPKAVMISHDNLTWTSQCFFEVAPDAFGQNEEHVVSYLPLSHIAAQMLDIHIPIAVAAVFPATCTIHFARPDALKGTLGETLRAVRPTVFFGVPRVWEKIAEKMQAIGAATTGVKKSVAAWAKAAGLEAALNEQSGESGERPFGFPLAKAAVLDKVRQALGLDRCLMAWTGAAPIAEATLRYFASLYIPIFNLYGMSESTGPQNVSYPGSWKLLACGRHLPGCEIKIDHDPQRDSPGEGEICFRGRHIMMGYMYNEEKTKEAIDGDGWLHSGDIGRLDKDGFLFITGRIKELIITAGGENIAPVPIEDALREAMPAVSNAMVVGDKRKYLVVVLTLKTEQLPSGAFSDKLVGAAREVDPGCATVGEARSSSLWTRYIEKGIVAANEHAVSRASRVQRFCIAPVDFSVAGGELTATLKLRRKVVDAMYAEEIEALYK